MTLRPPDPIRTAALLAIVQRAAALGVELVIDSEDRPSARPAANLPPDLFAQLRAHRDDLARLLRLRQRLSDLLHERRWAASYGCLRPEHGMAADLQRRVSSLLDAGGLDRACVEVGVHYFIAVEQCELCSIAEVAEQVEAHASVGAGGAL